jgi:hypothetical protein
MRVAQAFHNSATAVGVLPETVAAGAAESVAEFVAGVAAESAVAAAARAAAVVAARSNFGSMAPRSALCWPCRWVCTVPCCGVGPGLSLYRG